MGAAELGSNVLQFVGTPWTSGSNLFCFLFVPELLSLVVIENGIFRECNIYLNEWGNHCLKKHFLKIRNILLFHVNPWHVIGVQAGNFNEVFWRCHLLYRLRISPLCCYCDKTLSFITVCITNSFFYETFRAIYGILEIYETFRF